MTVVAVLVQEGAIGFEVMIPGQVFGMANMAAAEGDSDRGGAVGSPRYDIRVCAVGRSVTTLPVWGATELRTPFGPEAVAAADIVVVPGAEKFLEEPDSEVLDALRAAAARGARIATVCVGAFTVAAAGLLDGKRATTHWQWTDELARRYPAIDVDPTVLFVDNGQILTSAGMASGLDMCLHLVRSGLGAELASRTARRLVLPLWRDGGQAQYIEHPDPVDSTHSLAPTIEWMERNAAEPLGLEAIAARASMSVRSLTRHFRTHVGTTPLALLVRMRVDRARRLLESTELSVDRVARESGFGSEASLRYHFTRSVGVAPQKYRSSYLTAS
jgi:transcriptional regulator GlxA family with amidase domain